MRVRVAMGVGVTAMMMVPVAVCVIVHHLEFYSFGARGRQSGCGWLIATATPT